MDKQVLAAIQGTADPRAVEDFFDTAMANPDDDRMGGPFDGVQGLSTLTRQKIAKSISFAGLSETAYDVYIVDWGVELNNTAAGQCYAEFVLREVNPATAGAPGLWMKASTVGAWNAIPALPEGLVVGGVKAYIMRAGDSPFPSKTPDINGPVAPLKIISLDFGKDVLHDSMRILGSNYEYIDTTNALNQQGSCFQGSWDTPQQSNIDITVEQFGTGWVPSGNTAVRGLPPGDTSSLVKLNNCRIGKAKDGTFVHTRLDWAENKPHFPAQCNTIWIGSNGVVAGNVITPTLVGYTVGLAMYSGPLNSPTGTTGMANSYFGYCYPTAKMENMTVFTGLGQEHTATIERTLITQCFVLPDSEYKAFAALVHNPVDYEVMQRMQNTMDTTPEFWPSAANANGSFIKKAKSIWKKLSPVVKPIAGVAARTLLGAGPAVTSDLMQQASNYARQSAELNGAGYTHDQLVEQLNKMRNRAKAAEAVVNTVKAASKGKGGKKK